MILWTSIIILAMNLVSASLNMNPLADGKACFALYQGIYLKKEAFAMKGDECF